MKGIPVVDMKSEKYEVLSEEERVRCLGNDILAALKSIGFVYLLNHGIPSSLRESTKHSALELFALPLDVKKRYHRFIHTRFNGYAPMLEEMLSHSEYSNEDILELRETWDVMDLNQDMPEKEAPDFCRGITALMRQCESLSQRVMTALEIAMNRPGLLTSVHQHQLAGEFGAVMRSVYYPPVTDLVQPGAVRCTTHSDWGSLTFLMQDDVGGLEILNKVGEWVAATPLPDAVLLNVGDLIEIWTGGLIPATKHRVRMPAEEKQMKTGRLTLVFFGTPSADTMIVPPEDAKGYKTVNAKEYLYGKLLGSAPNSHLKVQAHA